MSLVWVLLGVAGVLALVAGRRRSKYDGVPPRAWWEGQRMLRTRGDILGRLARVVLGAAFLVAAFVFGALLIGTLLVGLLLAAVLLAGWWYMRAGARAAAPHVYPAERDDLDLPPVDGHPLGEAAPAWPDLPPARGLPAAPVVDDDPVMEV